ncbi:hypothetical protein [Clostridium tagluense]|uniref:Uncharacterized protein n=1 Tax=Clostridium tagluense TaxID=360422 RepID=A0A401UT03_9CLOT|nr:hypothetical protein [Clostridium tagluense]GCD12644.1 hypothetical protein Ctaglu_42670 [Clostridium tagluense]
MLNYKIKCVFTQINGSQTIISEGANIRIKGLLWDNGEEVDITGKVANIDPTEYRAITIIDSDNEDSSILIDLDTIKNVELIQNL